MPYILSIRSGDSMGRNTIFFVFEHKIRMTKQKKTSMMMPGSFKETEHPWHPLMSKVHKSQDRIRLGRKTDGG
jgi:hypothetical protein